MRKVKVLLLSLFFLFFLNSCQRGSEPVSLFIYDRSDLYINNFSQQIEAIGDPYFSIRSFNAKGSQLIQNEQIEEQFRGPSPLYIINPVDRLASYAIIRKLNKQNIPIIFFNREPLKKDLFLGDNVYYVGSDPCQAGLMQAEMALTLFGEKSSNLNPLYDKNRDGRIQAVIIKGEQGHQDAEFRTNALIDGLKKEGFKLDLLKIEVANWKRGEAYEKASPLIEKWGDSIEVIFSNNDEMALGLIDALQEHNFLLDTNKNGSVEVSDQNYIPIISIDGIPLALEKVEQGALYGTIYQDSKEMARAIVALAANLIYKGNPSSLDYPLIDKRYIWIDYQKIQKKSNK